MGFQRYSEETIKTNVLDKFLQYELPLNVLQMDCGWHKNNTHGSNGNQRENPQCMGYNGYDWNEQLFPDPVKFVTDVKAGTLSNTRPVTTL